MTNRRDFFRASFERVIRPLTNFVERRIPAPNVPPDRPHLRPPGAIAEPDFLTTCHRCGKCVAVCPANAIFPLDERFDYAPGTPVIDPGYAACVVCDGLQCTHVCPSGALLPLTDPGQINMGRAEVNTDLCIRTHNRECTLCVDLCPSGTAAIRFDGPGPPIVADGCTGCGVCQFHCPTTPKAIAVHNPHR